jgi:hypothetical protein
MSAEEDARIDGWKLEYFERLGFDEPQQTTLLAWRIDPHDAEDLVKRECPPDLVLRILQPDDDFVVLATEPEYSVKV